MGVVASLLDSRAATATLRRGLPRDRATPLTCRGSRHLGRTIEERLVDSIVVGPKAMRELELAQLQARFPRIPLVIFGPIRATDSPQVLEWLEARGVTAVLVEGVDDPVVGEAVVRSGLAARRRAVLARVPEELRLTAPLQRTTWELLTATLDPPPPTAVLARRLGVSREHLSRQFGAGGAPNLKRVIDLLQVVAARELLANPGSSAERVARLLGYASRAHFRAVVRRVAGSGLEDLSRLAVPELVRRFRRGRMRSRG